MTTFRRNLQTDLAVLLVNSDTAAGDFVSRSETYDRRAAAVLDAGYRKPRTITTEAELEALPKGVVIHSDEDGVFERGVPYWRESGSTFVMPSEDIALPATVLWEPDA